MKILIDNESLTENVPDSLNFPEFCEQIMGILLTRNRSIGSCEIDGTLVKNIEEADELFSNCKVCKIASIPLAVALEATLASRVSGWPSAGAGMQRHGHAGAARRARRRSPRAGRRSAMRSRSRSDFFRALPGC